MSKGDVKVVAVRTGTVVIDDIGEMVTHGVVVTIPAAKALVSKDLYRMISQRVLFQIHAGPIHLPAPLPDLVKPKPEPPPRALVDASPDAAAREAMLEAEVRHLRDVLDQREQVLYAALVASQNRSAAVEGKLDQVLTALARQPTQVVVQGGTAAARPVADLPASDAPLFIPSEIKRTDIEAHVSIESESQESGVGDAKAALRRLRKGGAGQ